MGCIDSVSKNSTILKVEMGVRFSVIDSLPDPRSVGFPVIDFLPGLRSIGFPVIDSLTDLRKVRFPVIDSLTDLRRSSLAPAVCLIFFIGQWALGGRCGQYVIDRLLSP